MLVDTDNFKKINDSLGLVYGDELVQSLALFIKGLSTDKIKVGRYGSDVFAIAIFDPCGKNCSDMIFKTIRDRVKKPFILTNKAEVTINRKMLSEIAIDNPKAFADLVVIAKDALNGKVTKRVAKVESSKAEAKVSPAKKTTAKKETAKKETTKKETTAKKPAAKKTTAKKTTKEDK